VLGVAHAAPTVAPARAQPRLRALVVIVDGLRPDLITTTRTPHLAAFGARGVVGGAHHAIVPTVTRVNASALVTGAGPSRHGILDNTIFLPAVDSARVLDTGNGAVMERADSILEHRLLTVPTLPDLLAARGLRMAVASSGSSGSAFLLAGAGRAPLVNTTMVRPRALETVVTQRLGPYEALEGAPNLVANARAVDALLRVVIDSLDPDVAMLWLSDPDHTAHRAGLGSMLADSAMRAVDREVGRVVAGLAGRGLDAQTTVFIVSDHGFSTQAGREAPLRQVLAPFRSSIVEAGGAVYLRSGHEQVLDSIVQTLQASPAVGAVFTHGARPGDLVGRSPGTLSFAAADWAHARAGDVLVSANWSHERNAADIPGWTALAGVAGHGTTSPYDIRATLLVAGPGIRRGDTSAVPTANSDIAPTILSLLGGRPAPSMSGRVLDELFRNRAPVAATRVRRDSAVASTTLPSGMRYRVTLHASTIGRTRYVDSTVVRRDSAAMLRPAH
jgi:arylsulfatase A-like enzyme